MNDIMRVAVIGCGLIAEKSHIPAILRSDDAHITALVDSKRSRAEELKARFELSCSVHESWEAVPGSVDAAVVAVPSFLLARVTGGLLQQGVHVLCEKPLALSSEEAGKLCDIAEQTGTTLAVGFVHRFQETTDLVKTVMEEKLIGEITGYDLEFGVQFDWPSVSSFYFDRTLSGGGVLMSEAVHWLDRLLYWFGDVQSVECADNNDGGIETEAQLSLTHLRAGTFLRGTARFSWLYDLRNSLEVFGTEGTCVVRKDNRSYVEIHKNVGGRNVRFDMKDATGHLRTPLEYFELQFQDFRDAVVTGRKPKVSGREGSKAVSLVGEAYRGAARISKPWEGVLS